MSMGWFEDTVTWCAGGQWMFAALLFPGSSYPMGRQGGSGNYNGAEMAKQAGPLFDSGSLFGTRRWFAGPLAAPECSVIVLTESELIAHSAKFDPYSQGVNQGLKSIGSQLTRWRREDVRIEVTFTKLELHRTQKMMVCDIDLQNYKTRFFFTNRNLGLESIMNSFTPYSEEIRAQAWSDRSVLEGNWTADFACFAPWWSQNPTATISA